MWVWDNLYILYLVWILGYLVVQSDLDVLYKLFIFAGVGGPAYAGVGGGRSCPSVCRWGVKVWNLRF